MYLNFIISYTYADVGIPCKPLALAKSSSPSEAMLLIKAAAHFIFSYFDLT